MISSGGAGARGTNGTDSPATARTRSGCSHAVFQATSAPQSWPITIAALCAAWSSRPSTSRGEHIDRVRLDLRGSVGATETAHVGHDHAVAGVGERPDLVAPGEPQLRKPVQQHDGGAASGL